jgi:hypothetical protein
MYNNEDLEILRLEIHKLTQVSTLSKEEVNRYRALLRVMRMKQRILKDTQEQMYKTYLNS